MPDWRFRALFLLLCATGSAFEEPASTGQLLIRPLYVYEGLIKGVHDYFNNTCIILFHGASDRLETNELGEIEGLLTLQRYLSGSLNIRTSIMDFHMVRRQIGTSYFHIKRPLFVLLNDLDEIRDQFSLVGI